MGSGDILANATFTVSPDPIVKGQPLTINMAGDLSAAITAGKLAVDLNIKALGIINEPLKLTSISLSRYSSSPSQSRPLCHSPSLPVSLLDRSRFHSVQCKRRLRQTPASPSRSTAPSRFPMARHLRLPA